MAPKAKTSDGGGCAALIGIALLVVTLGWPLFAFHRHWTSSRIINCALNQSAAVTANGCSYDYRTGGYYGYGTVIARHSAISATGWITEVIWLAVIGGGLVLLGRASARKRSEEAVTKGTVFASGKGPRTVRDVVDPDLPRKDRSAATLPADHLVKNSELDTPGKLMLARAQEALEDVLSSTVYSENQLERAAAEPALRSHEWAMAVGLREIAALRNEQVRIRSSLRANDPGPLTKAVVEAQDDALRQKLANVESVVVAIEEYAAHVRAADKAHADWRSAAELSKLNTKFTDLVAGTGADEVGLRQVEDLAEEASFYREAIQQANLAAQQLFLPDTAINDAN